MRARAPYALVLLFGALVPIATATPCLAVGEGEQRASLLIDDGSDVRRYCLSFEGAITGTEALRETGLSLRLKDFGAGKVAVCAIDGVGCTLPDQDCFCRYGEGAVFWAAYRADARGAWSFSQLGASDMIVTDGSVDAWRYAAHTPQGGNAPVVRADTLPCAKVAAVTPTSPRGALVATAGLLGSLVLMVFVGWRLRRRLEDG